MCKWSYDYKTAANCRITVSTTKVPNYRTKFWFPRDNNYTENQEVPTSQHAGQKAQYLR